MPEGINAITPSGDYEEVTLYVDSGASETVVQTGTLSHIAPVPGEAHRLGVRYEVANGETVPNEGERDFVGQTEEGHIRAIKAQVADVNKDLLSVSRMVKNGCQVVFHPSGSYAQDLQTSEKFWLKESGGMYTLSMWVRRRPF